MIFIDASALLARYIDRDQHHAAAVAQWKLIGQTSTPCVTSSHVVSEALTLLARRTDDRFAAERARRIYASADLDVVRSTANDEVAAIVWLERLAGHRVSFVDCISFALMSRLGIAQAFTFDADFRSAGFEMLPSDNV